MNEAEATIVRLSVQETHYKQKIAQDAQRIAELEARIADLEAGKAPKKK